MFHHRGLHNKTHDVSLFAEVKRRNIRISGNQTISLVFPQVVSKTRIPSSTKMFPTSDNLDPVTCQSPPVMGAAAAVNTTVTSQLPIQALLASAPSFSEATASLSDPLSARIPLPVDTVGADTDTNLASITSSLSFREDVTSPRRSSSFHWLQSLVSSCDNVLRSATETQSKKKSQSTASQASPDPLHTHLTYSSISI